MTLQKIDHPQYHPTIVKAKTNTQQQTAIATVTQPVYRNGARISPTHKPKTGA